MWFQSNYLQDNVHLTSNCLSKYFSKLVPSPSLFRNQREELVSREYPETPSLSVEGAWITSSDKTPDI